MSKKSEARERFKEMIAKKNAKGGKKGLIKCKCKKGEKSCKCKKKGGKCKCHDKK
jgi:hypothetical protein